ncbi:hypothetical protein [Hymenobacter sp. GOD-10R]|uniref:hypothetical protein n=1 Tax=Hymenobacter sp. GOD-10R TaxID=3093922 RepID=UPI002D78EA98|nr:hypothetical protein [Hymenobacter sp. GOD-10R]WRQ26679.1 hypothetical protein SD425_16525 [Hymenobacter sp. GOD-10R]
MAEANETVIIRIQLDPAQEIKKMEGLTLELETNRKAQQELTAMRKAGTIADEEFAKRQVELKGTIGALQKEYNAASKNLDAFNKSTELAEGSVDQLKAQLAANTAAYNALSKAERENSEAGKLLQAETLRINEELKLAGASIGDYRRNVGDYANQLKGSFESIVQELVKLQEQQKDLDQSSRAFGESQAKIAGFMTAAQQAAAKQGKSYEEATNAIENYSKEIQPAVQNLVKLEQEQAKIVETGGEMTESYRKIGFQIAAANKTLSESTAETKEAKVSVLDLAKQNGVLGGAIDKVSDLQAKYSQAAALARAATAGETLALGALRLALIATGLGAFLVILGSLVTFLAKTREGTQLVETAMTKVGAVVDVLTDRIGTFGKAVFQALSGDFSAAAETARQSFAGVGDEIERETKLAGDLSKARQRLERDQINNIDTNKKLLNQVERLKNIRDDEFNSLTTRRKANEDAYKIELERESRLVDLAKRRVDILQLEIERRGGFNKANNEQLKEFKEAQNELVDIQEDAAGKQNELITNRFQLEKEARERAAADTKAYYEQQVVEAAKGSRAELEARIRGIRAQAQADLTELGLTNNQRKLITAKADFEIQQARLAFQQQAIQQAAALENVALNQRLQQVQVASDEELNIRQRQLKLERDGQLAAANLTLAQRKTIQAKYDADSTKLLEDTFKQRAALEVQQEVNNITARLATIRKGSDEEIALQKELIEQQRQQQQQAIDDRIQGEQRAAQERLINANAEAQTQEIVYQSRLKAAETFFQEERNQLEKARAGGKLTEQEYQDALFQQELAHISARRSVNEQFNRDTAADDQALTDLRIANLERITAKSLESIETARTVGEQIGELFGQLLSDTGLSLEEFTRKTLVILLDALEKSVITATVEATAKSIASLPFPLNLVAAAGQVALIKAAFGAVKGALAAPPPKQFAQGTVLGGASHEQGGVQLYSRSGYHYGEAEKDEIILAKGVWRNPSLRPVASMLNVLGGGKPLTPAMPTLQRPRFADGTVIPDAYTRQYLRGNVPPSASEIGKATAQALKGVKLDVGVSTLQDSQRRQAVTDSRSGE